MKTPPPLPQRYRQSPAPHAMRGHFRDGPRVVSGPPPVRRRPPRGPAPIIIHRDHEDTAVDTAIMDWLDDTRRELSNLQRLRELRESALAVAVDTDLIARRREELIDVNRRIASLLRALAAVVDWG